MDTGSSLQHIDKSGFSPKELEIFHILDTMVHEKFDIGPASQKAAKQLSHLVVVNEQSQEIENVLWSIWTILILIAGEIKPGSIAQTNIAQTIKNLKEIDEGKISIWNSEYSLWADLPLLGPCMRDAWFDPTLEYDHDACSMWMNLNSFAACLLSNGCATWANLALWQLRTALEMHTAYSFEEVRVKVAIEWISMASDQIFTHCQQAVDLDEATARALAPGTLYKGKPGFTLHRWRFWKDEFQMIIDRTTSVQSNVSRTAGVREPARSAVAQMERTERDHNVWDLAFEVQREDEQKGQSSSKPS